MADARDKREDAANMGTTHAAGHKAKETAAGTIEGLKDKVQDVASSAKDLAGRAKDGAYEWASSIGAAAADTTDKAGELAGAAFETVGDLPREITAMIRRYPVPCVLAGLGVGVLLGIALSRRL